MRSIRRQRDGLILPRRVAGRRTRVASPDLSCLSLCSGIGGLELGLRLALGGVSVVAYCERDPFAASVLLARMEDKTLEPAPIWCGDLRGLDAGLFAGVDIVTAGFPCQPFSVAGKQEGTADERWIWPDIVGALRVVSPRLVFLENVRGLLADSRGFGSVLGDLADLGLDAEWGVFSAAGVGAPHLRQRVFILAYRMGDGDRTRRAATGPGRALETRREPEQGRGAMGDPASTRPFPATQRRADQQEAGGGPRDAQPERRDGSMADAERHQLRDEPGRRDGPSRPCTPEPGEPFPPPPGYMEAWGAVLARYPELEPSVANPESGQEGGAGDERKARRTAERPDAESALRGVADGIPDRVERLRALGNAVVPMVAATAFRVLAERAGVGELTYGS